MAASADRVVVIDDDPSVREGLDALLRSVGLKVSLYGSVSEFLNAPPADGPTCLVLDVRLPGQGGLDFQKSLSEAGVHLPIVFITGHGDIPMSVRAMKGGAVEFMTKPFRDQELLDAILAGLERDRTHRSQQMVVDQIRARYESLTPREREVMDLVVTGQLNKQIAATVGLSEITVKTHRGSVMRKMQAKTFADLVLIAQRLKATFEL
jgi:FixJ family two-component response regulator